MFIYHCFVNLKMFIRQIVCLIALTMLLNQENVFILLPLIIISHVCNNINHSSQQNVGHFSLSIIFRRAIELQLD